MEIFMREHALALNERKESHDAGALYRALKLALVAHADFGSLARDDLRKRREEAAQDANVLVVDVMNVVVAEVALLLFLDGWICFFHTS